VLGSKFTLARRVAERAVNTAQRKLGYAPTRCTTAEVPLAGASHAPVPVPGETAGGAIAKGLFRSHGSGAGGVVDTALRMHDGLLPIAGGLPTLRAEVLFAVQHEMAQHLDDVVRRRTALGALGHPGTAALRECAEIMAPALGWSAGSIAREVERTAAGFPIAPRAEPARTGPSAGDPVALRAGV
jgi:glycerol-3-phosphate dehydrogenase